MQNLVIAEPYKFVPPIASTFWTWPLRWYMPGRVRRAYGVTEYDFRGKDKITEAMAAGHSLLIAPNHCRPCDPEVIAIMFIQLGQPFFMMASWHLFKQGWLQRFLMRASGIFSVHREGVDREAIRAATAMLVDGRRPLVIFPEGIISRSNDRLRGLMDGTAFIARAAAKVKAKQASQSKVMIVPVAMHYYFGGDLRKSVTPVLEEIERRLGWQPQVEMTLRERILKLGEGLLGAKEVEYFGHAQSGPVADRLPKLFDQVMGPLEKHYRVEKPQSDPMERIKTIRTIIVDQLVKSKLPKDEVDRRWRHLTDCYFGQQLACYPPNYLADQPTAERLLETVERYEEDLKDVSRVHPPLRVVGQVGELIEVSPERSRGESDPAMKQLDESLRSMLAEQEKAGTVWSE